MPASSLAAKMKRLAIEEELANLELQLICELGQGVDLGLGFPVFDSPAQINHDIETFSRDYLTPVLNSLTNMRDLTEPGISSLKSRFMRSGVTEAYKDIGVKAISKAWRFNLNKKAIYVLFCAGASSSYLVISEINMKQTKLYEAAKQFQQVWDTRGSKDPIYYTAKRNEISDRINALAK